MVFPRRAARHMPVHAASRRNPLVPMAAGVAVASVLACGGMVAVTGSTMDAMRAEAASALAGVVAMVEPGDGTSAVTGKASSNEQLSENEANTMSETSGSENTAQTGEGTVEADKTPSEATSDPAATNETDETSSVVESGSTEVAQESPDNITPVSQSQEYDIYTVKWGDTLSSISFETGVSIQSIAVYNDLDDVNLIYANSTLRIPR